jgi:hypothetical protein
MLPHGREHLRRPRFGDGRRVAQQQQRPAPGDEPKRHLEGSGPVDADTLRVGGKPPVDRRDAFGGVTLVTRQYSRLRQAHHPLMAIQLPDDPAVIGVLGTQRIEVPIDRIAKPQGLVAEKRELPLRQCIGRRDNLVDLAGHRSRTSGATSRSVAPRKKRDGASSRSR